MHVKHLSFSLIFHVECNCVRYKNVVIIIVMQEILHLFSECSAIIVFKSEREEESKFNDTFNPILFNYISKCMFLRKLCLK